MLSSEIRVVDRCTVLQLTGEFNVGSSSPIRRTLTDLIGATVAPIVVDLGQVTSVDAGALGVLVAADHRLRARATRLRVARPRADALETMRAAGMDRLLRIYNTVEEACVDGS
jgi:anti-anti-sigma factor